VHALHHVIPPSLICASRSFSCRGEETTSALELLQASDSQ
jgi:hypothetical protein